jgi:hypothetical protein
MAVSCKYGDEPAGSGATDLDVSTRLFGSGQRWVKAVLL